MNEETRKEEYKLMTIIMSLVIGALGAYLCGYIGSLMGDGLSFSDSCIRMVRQIMDTELLYSMSTAALTGMILGFVATALIAFFLLSIDNEKYYAYKADEVAGTGGFMSKKELKQYNAKYINPEKEKATANSSPFMIMSSHFLRPIDSMRMKNGNNNVMIVGGAGTGKSRYVIKPNMLQMNASFVITDPSGEMIYSLGKVLKDNGYKIKIFNISDMSHSNCYNPFHYIRDEAGVNMLVECFITNTTNNKSSQGEQFFRDAEKLLYCACIFYLRDFCRDMSRKNFPSVMNMINASSVDENNTFAKSPLDLLFDKLPQDSLAWKYYKGFKQAAGKTLKSIIISCVTRLQPFMTPQVINLTKTDELELDKIGYEKTALFIITPQADRTYSFLASMLYSQAFETWYFQGEQQKAATGSERMPIPIRCLMDEFANSVTRSTPKTVGITDKSVA